MEEIPPIEFVANLVNNSYPLIPLIEIKSTVRINRNFVSIRSYERLPAEECLVIVGGGPQTNNYPFVFVAHRSDPEQSEANYLNAFALATERKMRKIAMIDEKIDRSLSSQEKIAQGTLAVAQAQGVRRLVITKTPVHSSVAEMSIPVQDNQEEEEEAKRIKK
eukprot:PhF_6_TR19808/c0_g1_i1/m.28880